MMSTNDSLSSKKGSFASLENLMDAMYPTPSPSPAKAKIEPDLFHERIEVKKELYSEALSPCAVYLAHDKFTEEPVVLKKICKESLLSDLHKKRASQEFPLHASLDHPKIVKCYSYTETDREHLAVMEYVNDASYFKDKIEVRLCPVKSEIKLKSYTNDILEALDYLHTNNIVHCDIKLENLFRCKIPGEEIPMVKVGDFGLAHLKEPMLGKAYMQEKCGSFAYLPPEVQSDAYIDDKADIWSLGICLYQMAVAYKPTAIGNYKYGSGPVPFRKLDWKKRSPELLDLVSKMLEYSPEKRITAKEALEHPWFSVGG